METTTPFDLNRAIQRWRENLDRNVNALESQLRDSIATLQTQGLSAEEAFAVASGRIGQGTLRQAKSGKAIGQVWLDRGLWILIGFQALMIFSAASSTAGWAIQRAAGWVQPQRLQEFRVMLWTGIVYYLLPSLLLVAVAVAGWKLFHKADGRVRDAVAGLLLRPGKLALALFAACLGFTLLHRCFFEYVIYPAVDPSGVYHLKWRFILDSASQLPLYALCAIFTFIFARKRRARSESGGEPIESADAFDLSLAIQGWRETLSQSAAFRSENLNELESHLRDSVATLQNQGLSVAEAFRLAAKRIGGSVALEREFGKVNGPAIWLDRILWLLIGFQIWMIVSPLCSSAWMAISRIQSNLPPEFNGYPSSEIVRCFIRPLFLLALIIIGRRFLRGSDGKIGDAIAGWLLQPGKLALNLFLACLFSGALPYWVSVVLGSRHKPYWQVWLMGLDNLPLLAACSVLTVIFARKRLLARKA